MAPYFFFNSQRNVFNAKQEGKGNASDLNNERMDGGVIV